VYAALTAEMIKMLVVWEEENIVKAIIKEKLFIGLDGAQLHFSPDKK
jgi:hypothetical protein